MSVYMKIPDALLGYNIDWRAYLQHGETVIASDWHVTPAQKGGLSITAEAHEPARTAVTLHEGRTGALYQVTNRVATSLGRIDERGVSIQVQP